LTGFASSNWIGSFGSPDVGLINPVRNPRVLYPAATASFVDQWDIGEGSIFLTNNVDYINILEAGRVGNRGSFQAPSGMLGVAAVETLSRFSNVRAGRDVPLPFEADLDTGPLGAAIAAIDAQLRQALTQLKGARTEIDRIEAAPIRTGLTRAILDVDRSVTSVIRGVTNLRNVLLGLGIGQLGQAVLKRVIEFERAERVFGIALETQEEVNQALDFAAAEADRLGADTLSLTLRFADFLTASQATDINAAEVFSDLAGSFNNLGISVVDFDGAFLGVVQIMSRGIVSTEDLRQISDRVPGALAAAQDVAKALGGELSEMLEDGKLIAEEFLPLFAEELSKRIGVEATESVEGTGQDIQRFRDEIAQLSTKFIDAEASSQIAGAIERLRVVISNPAFREIAVEIGDFAGDGLSFLASNLDAIFIALSSLVALKLAAGVINAARLLRTLFSAASFLNPWTAAAQILLLVGEALLIVTDTNLIEVTVAVGEAIGVAIDAVVGVAEAIPSAFAAIPALISETMVSLFEAIAGAFEEFANSMIEGFNLVGQFIGFTIDPLNLDFDSARDQLAKAGEESGLSTAEEFTERWSLNLIEDTVTAAEREIVPDLIDISTGLDEAASTIDTAATTIASAPIVIDEVTEFTISGFATFLGETREAGFEIEEGFDVTFDRVATSSGAVFEGETDFFGRSTEDLGTLSERALDVFQDATATVAEATGIELGIFETAFELGSSALDLFADELEEAVGGTATEAILAFGEFATGNLTGLDAFLRGIWGQYLGFFDELTFGLGGVFVGADISKQTDSTAASISIANTWAKGKELFDTVAGFTAGTHATVNQGHASATSASVSTQSREASRFADSFTSTTNQSSQTFGAFVNDASASFASFVNTAIQAGEEIANIGATALGGAGGVLSNLDQTTGAVSVLRVLSGVGLGTGTGEIPDVETIELAFGPETPAQAAGRALAERIGSNIFGSNFATIGAGIGFTIAGPVGALALGGLTKVAVDFATDLVLGEVGSQVAGQLDRLSGGVVSSVLGTVQRGIQSFKDFTGLTVVENVIGDARDFVFSSVRDLASSAARTVGSFLGIERGGNDGGGSFSDSSSFGGRDRTSQPSGSGGIGSFALGGVIKGLAGDRASQASQASQNDGRDVFLELARSPHGKLSVIAPARLEKPVVTSIVANFEGASPAAVETFRHRMERRGFVFREDPVVVREVIDRLELESA